MMVERVGIIENMEDQELEMLLGEIPHATSSLSLHHHPSYANGHHHHHHHHHVVNGNPRGNLSFVAPTMNRMMYGMYNDDDDSSSSYNQNTYTPPATAFPSMFYNAHSHSSSDASLSPSSSSTIPTLHDPIPNPHIISRNPDENLIDELGRLYINQDRINSTKFGASDDYLAINPHFPRTPITPDTEIHPAFFGFQQNYGVVPSTQSSNFDRSLTNYCYQWGIPAQIGKTGPKAKGNTNHGAHRFHHMAAGGSPNIRITRGGPGLSASDDSLIIQGEDLSRVRSKRFESPCENGRTKVYLSCSSHLTEAQRHIFMMAKDQHGCRLLQKIFDDGNSQHVQIVFNEIIGHVIELMINPFGNYLMQKLLEVCNEEQRMQILIAITREPRELVQISLNTHGTRVVQKLIETLKTRQQIKLVVSALEPGFLALIKDLNGNHVIQRCLQCLSNEDNKFIFEAAAKHCVEIATHQHGCCVLQRCINHSTGEHREKLVSEISANGLLLAQDAFGNYVVQYILELQIPSAVSKLMSQFEGNYVHLATQKFSSHVVEKCLAVLDGQIRSTIIRELISATHFEQVLQDPHANYVVQTALRVSEGQLHNALVNAIESHKAISRNSPYSKRIFSHKLLRR
ncbi:putative pumilio homolog 8, chloroplastic [Lactuca sativa]|nr:putative pumilio homolog 8, chloroplastic [Lactuca sativa]